ncbi:Alpha/Beta hydrolase protein [Globomyces pollinis-pini]|nr:Alpha/Beta hydrolase protein [Globomyces pollinis-pini]
MILTLLYYSFLFAIFYAFILGLLIYVPYPFQSIAIYLHFINFPFFVNWDKDGERFGFRAGSVKNIKITTRDGITLGGWHILPRNTVTKPKPNMNHVDKNVPLSSAELVFLYFHGNAGNRATFHRTDFYKMMTSLVKTSHVVAIDYRGFGDSTFALPTEEGLKIDALAAYDWIVAQGVDPSRIIIVGHSLGSGVATDLAHTISVNKAKIGSPGCGGLVILSGYASIADASLGYPMVPVLKPFCGYPEYEKWVKSKMTDKWHSAKKMPFVSCPVLIIHGFKDFEIRPWQARALFLQAAQGRLEKPLLKEDEGFWELRQPRPFDAKEVAGISVTHLDGDEGTLWSLDHSMTPNSSTKTPNHVWFLEVKHAGHNTLSTHQVVKDTIDSWVEGI